MAGAALASAWISLPRLAFALAAAGIALGCALHVAQALQRGVAPVRALELDDRGGARLQDGHGQWHEAEVLPGSYVSAWLIVVRLGVHGGRGRALVLLPDSAAAEELRRLRVWLRWRLGRP